MKKRYLALTVAAVALFLNLIIPACGNQNATNNGALNAYSCIPGQQCVGVSGTPMFPSGVYTSIDSYGSIAQIMVYGSNYIAGQSGTGTVTIQAQVNIAQNGYGCPPGSYIVSGTGTFQANYGGTLGLVQAQLSGTSGFQVQMSGEIYQGQDPYGSMPTQYYYMGNFGNSCDPTAKGL